MVAYGDLVVGRLVADPNANTFSYLLLCKVYGFTSISPSASVSPLSIISGWI